MQAPEQTIQHIKQISRIVELNRRAKTAVERQQARGALVDAMIAQVPEWAPVLASQNEAMLQRGRGLFLDALMEVIEEGAEVRLILSEDVKQVLAAKHAIFVASRNKLIFRRLRGNPSATIELPQYALDHLKDLLQPRSSRKFDA